jgi:hypothetical protein
VAGDPVLLFRTTETHPNQVGPGSADFFADAVELVGGPIVEGGRMNAGDGGSGEAGGEGVRELVEGGGLTA